MSQHDEIYRDVPTHIREHDQRLERYRADIERSRQPPPPPPLPAPTFVEPFVPAAPRRPLTEEEQKQAEEKERRRNEQWEEFREKEADKVFAAITALVVAGLVIWADVVSGPAVAWYIHILIVALPTITSVLALSAMPGVTRIARKAAQWTLFGAIVFGAMFGAIKLLTMIL